MTQEQIDEAIEFINADMDYTLSRYPYRSAVESDRKRVMKFYETIKTALEAYRYNAEQVRQAYNQAIDDCTEYVMTHSGYFWDRSSRELLADNIEQLKRGKNDNE